MAEIQFFRKLFEYDYWANLMALDSLANLGSPDTGRPIEYFAHVLGASRIWLARFGSPDPQGIEVWPKPTLAECRAAVEELYRGWTALLNHLGAEGVARNLAYRNTKARSFRRRLPRY